MKRIVLRLIRLYQRTLSFDHGIFSFLYSEGFCRFKPTCSEYTYQAIDYYGIIRGGIMGLWRICRCNPWNRGGWDSPIKEEK
ncbi:MAG: membrane protein insertion efficiency factor YidD [Candidatus Bathyarchaeota archaeon]|nr:membrane protein insertion efficiency factor YidD [Candidatus Bathyarchaeota archaeon]